MNNECKYEKENCHCKRTVKVKKIVCGGIFYAATCPSCGKTKILSAELASMQAICNKCYTVFNLKMDKV